MSTGSISESIIFRQEDFGSYRETMFKLMELAGAPVNENLSFDTSEALVEAMNNLGQNQSFLGFVKGIRDNNLIDLLSEAEQAGSVQGEIRLVILVEGTDMTLSVIRAKLISAIGPKAVLLIRHDNLPKNPDFNSENELVKEIGDYLNPTEKVPDNKKDEGNPLTRSLSKVGII